MRKQNGFTIIEVSLVLGIAGLIFLMAFVALPALWGTARDSERRDDVLTFTQKLKDFQTNNNRGALPILSAAQESALNTGSKIDVIGANITSSGTWSSTSWEGFYRDFLPKDFEDPSGTKYNLRITKCRPSGGAIDVACNEFATYDLLTEAGKNTMYVILGAVCEGSEPRSSANPRRVAVLYQMERSNSAFCANT